MPAVLDDLSAEILDLKKQIGATILAHYYQEGEIQALADITGDSLKLAREATKVDSPGHRLLRRPVHGRDGQDAQPGQEGAAARTSQAGCSLVDSCPAGQARPLPGDAPGERPEVPDRQLHQQLGQGEGPVRLGRDVSGNAEDVVRNRVPAGYEILFVPDKHLGRVPAGGDRAGR